MYARCRRMCMYVLRATISAEIVLLSCSLDTCMCYYYHLDLSWANKWLIDCLIDSLINRLIEYLAICWVGCTSDVRWRTTDPVRSTTPWRLLSQSVHPHGRHGWHGGGQGWDLRFCRMFVSFLVRRRSYSTSKRHSVWTRWRRFHSVSIFVMMPSVEVVRLLLIFI